MIEWQLPDYLRAEDDERACGPLQEVPRSRLYPLLGVGLALMAPVGLVGARAMDAGEVPTLAWILADMDRLMVTYAYVALSTVAVFGFLGYVLGHSFDRVRRLSITDPLTGLLNRRHFGHRAAEEMRRGRRQGRPTCVLCVDIDRLKAINDSLGHKAGDRAIIVTGRILARNVRASDAVARIGGDEFAVLLPETSAAQASVLSQRILKEMARLNDSRVEKLTVSIGVTELDAAGDLNMDDMLVAGDAALYHAKAAGGGHASLAARPSPATTHVHHIAAMEEPRPRIVARSSDLSVSGLSRQRGAQVDE